MAKRKRLKRRRVGDPKNTILKRIKKLPLIWQIILYVPFVYFSIFYYPLKFIYRLILELKAYIISHRIHVTVPKIQELPKLPNPIKWIFKLEFRFRIFSFKTLIFVTILGTLYVGSVLYLAVFEDIPSSDKLMTLDSRLTTRIYDRKGNLLYKVFVDEDRTLVKYKDIPQNVINATVAIEDQTFFEHHGLSISGIVRAAKKTFLEEELEGGSTITQQLVKNTLLTSERTYTRKIKEAALSVEVERRFSKEQILEMYLNRISYGGTTYGIQSAAKKYFGKSLSELNLPETAFLAGLPVAPSTYSPYGAHPELGKARQQEVLRRMVEDGYITSQEASVAYAQELVFQPQNEYIKAPHFVNYVIAELEKKYGQMLVSQGGLEVFTSLDMDLQNELERIVQEHVAELRKNKKNVTNGAALITDPRTGEILSMVGSADYWDLKNDGNVNVTISPRQPGSSIKPVTYALAIENGYKISDILDDSPVTYPIAGQKPYSPVNYDGKFHGKITIKTALANSYNVPAVKLLDNLGVENLITFADNMGITTWTAKNTYGLSLTLGAGEVKMTDMAEAFGVFANQGYKKDLDPILKIYDSFGNVLHENGCVNFLRDNPTILTRRAMFETTAIAAEGSRFGDSEGIKQTCQSEMVIKPSTAYLINTILSDNNARTPAFGSNSLLNIKDRQVAVKSGTTTNVKDNWTIGYTDNFVVVTWVGNNNGEPMLNVVSGYRGASVIWRNAFDYLIKNREISQNLARPNDIIEVEICPLTNTLACAGCNNIKSLFVKGEEPKVACDSEQVKQIIEEQQKAKEEKESQGQD